MPLLLIPSGHAAPSTPGFPVVKIEVQFTNAAWTDITPYYDSSGGQQVTITRGSSRVDSPVIRYDAGTCSIPLVNTDRRFDPSNLSGPYVGGGTQSALKLGCNSGVFTQVNADVPGNTGVRAYRDAVNDIPSVWPGVPGSAHTMVSLKPHPTDLLAGTLDAKINALLAVAPANARLTVWHEAGNLYGQGDTNPATNPNFYFITAASVIAMHQYMQALVTASGSGVKYGCCIYGTISTMASWIPPAGHPLDFYGIDLYDNANSNDGGSFQTGGLPDPAKVATYLTEYRTLAQARSGLGSPEICVMECNSPTIANRGPFFNAIAAWLFTTPNGTCMYTFFKAGGSSGGAWLEPPADLGTVDGLNHLVSLYALSTTPVATQVRPVVPVRVSATYGGVTYRLFTGTADSWTLSYSAPYDAQVLLAATDGFKLLAANKRTGKAVYKGPGEDAGARVSRILDDAGWPGAQRNITPGDATLQATLLSFTAPGLAFSFNPAAQPFRGSGTNTPDWTFGGGAGPPGPGGLPGGGGPPDADVRPTNVHPATPSSTPLDELYLTADSEMGEMYVDGNGLLTFRHRNGIWTDTRSTAPQATFGDSTARSTQFLLGDNAAFEGGPGAWIADTNAQAPVSTAAQAHSGSKSLLIRSAAAGNAAVNSGVAQGTVVPGSVVTLQGWFRAAASPRTCEVLVNWLNSAGGYITTVSVATVTDTTTGWTFATGTVTAPAGAAFAQAIARIDGTGGAAEDHYYDDTFGSVAPELPYASLTPGYDDVSLWNGATIANIGGQLQQASDATSQAWPPDGNGPHVFDNQNLVADTDWQALGYAQWIVATSKKAELRWVQMTVNPVGDPNAADPVPPVMFPQVLGRQIGDRITAIMRPPGGGAPVTRDVLIRGISHAFTDSDWITTWTFQDITNYPQPMIWDDPVNGIWDSASWGF